MTRLLYKNYDFKVFSRIIKDSCAENNVNVCIACAVYRRTLLAGRENTNPLSNDLSRLLSRNIGSFMWLSNL